MLFVRFCSSLLESLLALPAVEFEGDDWCPTGKDEEDDE
jgi:hypothetical protein